MNFKLSFFITFFILIFTNWTVIAKQVDINTAKVVAKNCFYENINTGKKVDYDNITVIESFTVKDETDPVYYIFNFINRGFVIVSADDIVYPIIGYSLKNNYVSENQPDNFKFWMKHYKNEILFSRKMKSASNDDINSQWKHYLTKPDISAIRAKSIVVSPLLTCTWDQGQYYNALCPVDAAGPNGHAVTGCIATAMAQIMFYYRYPLTGVGTHSDHTQSYGTLTVNCGSTTYDWNSMEDNLTSANTSVATLIYQAGVTVNMDYSATGSGASTQSAANSFSSHFRYGTVDYNLRSNFTATSWMNLIKTELNANRLVLYTGNDTITGDGHAFVCDGYDSNNNFHFNWGWSGYYDGYYILSYLNPGNQDFFDNDQEALTNIYPASGYPYYCTGTTTITSQKGTIEDGSGSSNYQNNNDCRWLIAPPNAGSINLSFTTFSTESSNDQVIVYDGGTTSDSVLGTFSGNSIPPAVISTGGQMLIRFISNQTITSTGWHASYFAVIPPMCPSLTNLTAPSGTFSDGSGSSLYATSTSCDWEWDPPGATSISLGFTSFSLAAGDNVRLFDISHSPSVLLATFTGSSIPATAVYNTGQLVLSFNSTSTGSGQGWNAFYSSVISNVDKNELENSLNIYPNPAENLLNVNFNCNNSQYVELFLSTILGQNIYNDKIGNLMGKYSGTINISNFPKGIYFLKVTTEKETITRKIIVQ